MSQKLYSVGVVGGHELEDLGDVEVEEVAVEDGLHASGHDGDDVVEAWNKRATG